MIARIQAADPQGNWIQDMENEEREETSQIEEVTTRESPSIVHTRDRYDNTNNYTQEDAIRELEYMRRE